jgi:hypothetical protein
VRDGIFLANGDFVVKPCTADKVRSKDIESHRVVLESDMLSAKRAEQCALELDSLTLPLAIFFALASKYSILRRQRF